MPNFNVLYNQYFNDKEKTKATILPPNATIFILLSFFPVIFHLY